MIFGKKRTSEQVLGKPRCPIPARLTMAASIKCIFLLGVTLLALLSPSQGLNKSSVGPKMSKKKSVLEDFIGEATESSKDERLPRTKVIKTKYGHVQGRVVKIDTSDESVKLPDVQVFMGIRYATPPVGNNR